MHPEKAPSPIELSLLGSLIEVNPSQFLKVFFAIEETLSGISIDVSPVQPAKALSPIDVTPLGSLIELSPVQFSKVLLSINEIFSGISIDVRFLQSLKVPAFIEITSAPQILSGTVTATFSNNLAPLTVTLPSSPLI